MKDYKVFITEGTSGGLVHGRVKDTVKDFSGGSVVKNLPANAGDVSLILGWKDSLEKEMATHSCTLA